MIRKRKIAIVVAGALLFAGLAFGVSTTSRDGLKSSLFEARKGGDTKSQIYFSGYCAERTGAEKSACLSSQHFVAQMKDNSDILEYGFSLKSDKKSSIKSFVFDLKNTRGTKTAKFQNFRLATSITTDSIIAQCSLSVVDKNSQRITCTPKKPFILSEKNTAQYFYLNGDGIVIADGEYSIVFNSIATQEKSQIIGESETKKVLYFKNSHLIDPMSSIDISDSNNIEQRKYIIGQKDVEMYSFQIKSTNGTSKIAEIEVNSHNDHDLTTDNCFALTNGQNVLSNVRLYSGDKHMATGVLSSDGGVYRFSFLKNMIELKSGQEANLKIVSDIIPENFRGENYLQANCSFQIHSWMGLVGPGSNNTSHKNIVNVYHSALDITPRCGSATEGTFAVEPVWAWDYICIHPSSSTPVVFDATKIGPNGKGMWTWKCIPADSDWSKTIDCSAQSE